MNIYRSIPVCGGRVAWVDQDDYPMLSHWSWCESGRGYAVRGEKHGGRPRFVPMHRMILLPNPDDHCDHINGDRLDNRRGNLRTCSSSQNMANRGVPKNNTTGYKGVVADRRTGRFVAHSKSNGVARHLGSFRDPVDAALAYDLAAIRLFGEYARPNFLTSGLVE